MRALQGLRSACKKGEDRAERLRWYRGKMVLNPLFAAICIEMLSLRGAYLIGPRMNSGACLIGHTLFAEQIGRRSWASVLLVFRRAVQSHSGSRCCDVPCFSAELR